MTSSAVGAGAHYVSGVPRTTAGHLSPQSGWQFGDGPPPTS